MTIPSVIQGLIKTEDGKVFELDSSKGSAWLESIGSFRYEPSSDSKSYTVRKEAGAYWYGCRKIAGKVRKKYIGKFSEVTVAKLEEIAEALEIPPVPRANKVAEVAEVAERVTEVVQDRLTALELQVANLQKVVEALQEALLGKLESGSSLELPKVDNAVAEEVAEQVAQEVVEEVVEKLQNKLGNLEVENKRLQADYVTLLESSTHVTNKLRKELAEVRLQLKTERASWPEIEAKLSEVKQNSAPAATLSEKLTPDAATILSQLRARRKKSPVSLADIEAILEIIEES
jgi:hypothetical protein